MLKKQSSHHPKNNRNQLVEAIKEEFSHRPVVETEIDGVHMGVMEDGTAFMALRGLARMCGIDHTAVLRLANNWGEEVSKPRGTIIFDLLAKNGHPGDILYIRFTGLYGDTHAFPDSVCMAILEYYAFEAGRHCTEEAAKNFRSLARRSFQNFIYDKCGYDPSSAVLSLWQPFHDRVSLTYNTVPVGYFGVFHAIHELFIALGESGIHTSKNFVPDISVGMGWSAYWIEINGDTKYGARIKYAHDYPPYYPQALSNPQEPWAYPEMALGEFKKWFREHYVQGGKLTNYLNNQMGKKQLPKPFVTKALAALGVPANEPKLQSSKRSA